MLPGMDVVPFADVVGGYSTVFLDAFGVLKNSSGVLPGVGDVVTRLQDAGKHVFVVTNDASRSPEDMASLYVDADGVPLIAPERFVSSGMLACDYLKAKVPYGRVAYLGKPKSAHFIEIAGLIPVPIAECDRHDNIVAIMLLDDEGYDWFKDINRTLNLVRRTHVPVIVANADATYPLAGNDVALAVGSLASLLSDITEKKFVVFGKPDTMMFAYAYDMVLEIDDSITKRDILFVGDTLRTDVAGADCFGLDTALVLSGNTLPERAELMIRSSGITPTYVCPSITT